MGGVYLMPSNQSTEAYIQLGLTNLTSIGVTGNYSAPLWA